MTLRQGSPKASHPPPLKSRGREEAQKGWDRDKGPGRPGQAGSSPPGWRRRAADPGCHRPRAGALCRTCRAGRSPAVEGAWGGAAQAGPCHSPGPSGPWRGLTCSRCKTLLARRSNTTSVWSSLPEMMCRSSASNASTALECSRQLFSRAGPTLWVMGQGEGGYQHPSKGPPPAYQRIQGLHPLWQKPWSASLPTLQLMSDPSLFSCPTESGPPGTPGLYPTPPPPPVPSPSSYPICSQYRLERIVPTSNANQCQQRCVHPYHHSALPG